MAKQRQRDYTVLIMGTPGHEVARIRLGRTTLVVALSTLIVLPCVTAGLGYQLGRSGEASGPAPAAAAPASPKPAAAAPPAEVASAEAEAVEAAPAPEAEAEAEVAEGPPGDATLRVLPEPGAELVELHPFSVDGAPRPSAFEQLAGLLACADGEKQAPKPALVHLLVRLQAHFDRPMLLLGGRCGAHDDRPDATEHHRGGSAVDLRLVNVSSRRLSDWLVEQGAGGVGRYAKRGFVHVDAREGPGQRWEPEAPAEDADEAPPRRRPKAPGDAPAGAPAEAAGTEPATE